MSWMMMKFRVLVMNTLDLGNIFYRDKYKFQLRSTSICNVGRDYFKTWLNIKTRRFEEIALLGLLSGLSLSRTHHAKLIACFCHSPLWLLSIPISFVPHSYSWNTLLFTIYLNVRHMRNSINTNPFSNQHVHQWLSHTRHDTTHNHIITKSHRIHILTPSF